jgi:hypothetical protein
VGNEAIMKYFDALALSLALFPYVAFSQGYTNESEVHLYGLSPPVYPSRKFSISHLDSSMLTHYSRRRWQYIIFMGRSIRARKRHCIAINPRREVKPHTRCYRTMRRSNRRGTSSAYSGTMFRRCASGCPRTRIRVVVPSWNPSRRHI